MQPCVLLLLLLLCGAATLVSAAVQCFEGTVSLTSARTTAPCASSPCSTTYAVRMDLATRELHALGLRFGDADDVCLGELYRHGDYAMTCTRVLTSGSTYTVTVAVRVDYDDGWLSLMWRYSGIDLACDAFNTTLTPAGATFVLFQLSVLPPPGDDSVASATEPFDNTYSFATRAVTCDTLTSTCLTPPQRCYVFDDMLGLESGTQPTGNEACTADDLDFACLVDYQFRTSPYIANSTTGLVAYDVEDIEVTFNGREGWLSYCLSNTVATLESAATHTCELFTTGGDQNFVHLRTTTTQFALEWLYNLDNESMSCEDALFAPADIVDVRNYDVDARTTRLVALTLTDGGTSQWGDGDAKPISFFEIPCGALVAPNCVPSVTPSNSPTASRTPSNSPTPSATPSGTPTSTPSETATQTTSVSTSLSPTASITSSGTGTPSRTPSQTPSTSHSNTITPSETRTGTPSVSTTRTPTAGVTASITLSRTSSQTPSASRSASVTPTLGGAPPPTVPVGWRTATIVLACGAGVLAALLLAAAPTVWAVTRARYEQAQIDRANAQYTPATMLEQQSQPQVLETELHDMLLPM